MEIDLEPGRYVVAVSGGIDSMALAHALVRDGRFGLTVAHFDHGIRDDSADDAAFVTRWAADQGLPVYTERVELGASASEATARQARYDFLRRIKDKVSARAIITAHHQDDLLETVILNLQRGTYRKGLTPFNDASDIARPLLNYKKADIRTYAFENQLEWCEDSTNQDRAYRRNKVRHDVMPRLTAAQRQELLSLVERTRQLNHDIDRHVSELVTGPLDRVWFRGLPTEVAREVMAQWLRDGQVGDFSRQTVDRLSQQARQLQTGKRIDALGNWQIIVGKHKLALSLAER
ncbi:MAG: hypothetical protein JWM37_667 [Candidatus Saccharibacteria bacterium]|nr:hypothetical protein [Candidatus Saccharibacteria bacterium]